MKEPPKDPVKSVTRAFILPFNYVAGDYRARYFRALKDKKILGSKCSETGKVFVPPVRCAPDTHAPCYELVQVADRGVITTFCIVNINVSGRDIQIPYCAASVALDGASLSIYGLIQEVNVAEVRMGMRVEAVWKPDGERTGSSEDILYWHPTGEPDMPRESYINRL